MADAPMTNDVLAAALASVADDVFPPTPPLRDTVTSRIVAHRTATTRPPRPALWDRRRVLVAVAIGVLGLLALAAAARLVIGGIEVRVQPGTTPSRSLPPVEPDVLGDPVPLRDAAELAGFAPGLPAGPPPDEVYAFDSVFGDLALILAWRPDAERPPIGGVDWGLVLMAFQGEAELVVKTVARFEDVREIEVGGERAFWIEVPHVLEIETDRGVRRFFPRGNVLIWQRGDISYRLETSLGLPAAVRIADSVG